MSATSLYGAERNERRDTSLYRQSKQTGCLKAERNSIIGHLKMQFLRHRDTTSQLEAPGSDCRVFVARKLRNVNTRCGQDVIHNCDLIV